MKIIKIPGINNFGKNNGCRDAGEAILAELGKIRDISSLDVGGVEVDNSDVSLQEKVIYEGGVQSLKEGGRVAFIGGDHSISYSLALSFLEVVGINSKLIVFDAHADCDISMKEPSHEEWLRALVEKGFRAENIILVGVRKLWLEERQFLDKNKIKYYEFGKFEDNELLCDSLMEFANYGDGVYVSFDIDVVDPAFAPSTGHLEPGGFSSREILYFAKRLALLKKLKAVDIVEIDCVKDKQRDNMTVKLGAKILEEFL